MELRQYWRIVADRAAVVAITFVVALVVAAISVYLVPQTSTPYQAVVTLAVKPQLTPVAGATSYPVDYYAYIASEYAVDDLISVVESADFMQAVRARLQNQPGGAPGGSIKGVKAHRIVDFTVTSSSANGALDLAQGIADILTAPQSGAQYFSSFATESQLVSVVQAPRIVSQPAGRNALLNVAARALVGLACGIGLAFLLEYVDDTVRAEEVETLLGWPIVGEIPGRGLPAARSGDRGAPSGSTGPTGEDRSLDGIPADASTPGARTSGPG